MATPEGQTDGIFSLSKALGFVNNIVKGVAVPVAVFPGVVHGPGSHIACNRIVFIFLGIDGGNNALRIVMVTEAAIVAGNIQTMLHADQVGVHGA